MVENRRVGIKSRETYECPAALALLLAHSDLEDLTLERDVAHEKARLEPRWAELVYDGMWFSPLKEALDAFFTSTQRHVTGEVRLALAPGALHGHGPAQPRVALRPRARHLRRRRHLRPRRRRGVRAPVGSRRWPRGRRARAARRVRAPTSGPAGRDACGRAGSAARPTEVMAFTASLPYDRRLAADDLAGLARPCAGPGARRGARRRGGGRARWPRSTGSRRSWRRGSSSSRPATRTSTPRWSAGSPSSPATWGRSSTPGAAATTRSPPTCASTRAVSCWRVAARGPRAPGHAAAPGRGGGRRLPARATPTCSGPSPSCSPTTSWPTGGRWRATSTACCSAWCAWT